MPTTTPAQGQSTGPSVDRQGAPVIDPTENVMQLVAAATKRADDLMAANKELQREITIGQNALADARFHHLKELAELRAAHAREISDKEAERLNSIRSVDVGAVKQAAEVQAIQASALATTLATTAETLRNQVISTATAQAASLASTVQPLIKAIEDLRQAQFTQQGEKTQKSEGTQNNQWVIGVGIGIIVFIANEVSKRVPG